MSACQIADTISTTMNPAAPIRISHSAPPSVFRGAMERPTSARPVAIRALLFLFLLDQRDVGDGVPGIVNPDEEQQQRGAGHGEQGRTGSASPPPRRGEWRRPGRAGWRARASPRTPDDSSWYGALD